VVKHDASPGGVGRIGVICPCSQKRRIQCATGPASALLTGQSSRKAVSEVFKLRICASERNHAGKPSRLQCCKGGCIIALQRIVQSIIVNLALLSCTRQCSNTPGITFSFRFNSCIY
jgi:hypothetical protein